MVVWNRYGKAARRKSASQTVVNWSSEAFESELEPILQDVRLYLELASGSRVEMFAALRAQDGRPQRLGELASLIEADAALKPVDVLRGAMINMAARRVGTVVVLGSRTSSDQFFAAYDNPFAAFIFGPTAAVDGTFGCLHYFPHVHAFYDDDPLDFLKLLRVKTRLVVVDADGIPAGWLTKLGVVDAAAGFFFCGTSAAIERLLDTDGGMLARCAGIRRFSTASCPPDTAVIYLPPDALARVARERKPVTITGAPTVPSAASRVYAFPTRQRLLNIADGNRLLTAEHVKRITPPVFIGGNVPNLEEAIRAHTAAQIVAARHALEFDDLRVVGDGLCFTRNDYFFDGYYFDRRAPEDLIRFGASYWNVPLERVSSTSVRCARSEIIGREVPGRSFVLTAPNAVFDLFAHFALDFMPRVQLARELRREGDQIFVSSHIRERHIRAMMDVFGFGRDEIQIYDRDGPATRFERAVLIPGVFKLESATSDNADVYSRMMSPPRFPAKLDRERHKRIFTSRRDTRFNNPRLMMNIDQVAARLGERGFVEVVMSDFSFAEQMAIFHNADFVVGELGSSMQPINACHRGVNLVWIFGERAVEYYTYFVTHYSSAIDAPYAMVGCEQFGWSYNSHFNVDLEVLDKALDALGA